MIRYSTNEIELHSRLGRVGSIRAFDLWQFRESREACVEGVAQIASLSYGNEAAKNPQALFDRIISLGHLSCLEFVPLRSRPKNVSLPKSSIRSRIDFMDRQRKFSARIAKDASAEPATGFLVECPIFVARQWMRHRSFSYLEMSRRYVKGAKIAFEFYGIDEFKGFSTFHQDAIKEYDRRMKDGWPVEIARGCIPVEAMTRFYVGGFDRDWRKFVSLRADAHAQPEIRVFAEEIAKVIA